MTGRPGSHLEHREFLARWSRFIDYWAYRTVRQMGGSRSDDDDLKQSAYAAGWAGYQAWLCLTEDERTDDVARLLVGTAARDAIIEQWSFLTGVPRNSHARGAGVRAAVLRQSLSELGGRNRSAATRELTIARALVSYHVLTEGLVHGHDGLVTPETALLRTEVRERMLFAVDRLQPAVLRQIIEGHYFERRTFKDIGAELGIEKSKLSRLHFKALAMLHKELREFASALSARNTGHTLNDEPSGGTFT